MNSQQETSTKILETEFGGPAMSKKIIHFSNGETLEVENSEGEEEEEEEDFSNRSPFEEPVERTTFSFKEMALLIGRFSLLTCDFLGERLAGALGLNAAKYQYAIDQYHRDHQTTRCQVTEKQAETAHLSSGPVRSQYGATGNQSCRAGPWKSYEEQLVVRKEESHNKGYQAEENYLKEI